MGYSGDTGVKAMRYLVRFSLVSVGWRGNSELHEGFDGNIMKNSSAKWIIFQQTIIDCRKEMVD